MSNLIEVAKDLCRILLWLLSCITLLWMISHVLMATIKTIFCDIQIKLYREYGKRLRQVVEHELEKDQLEKDMRAGKSSAGRKKI